MGRERERVREGGLEGGREEGRVRGTVYNYVPAILEFKQSRRSVASPLTSYVTMEGQRCTGGRVRGGATSPRTKNSRGPGARQTGRKKTPLEQPRQARCQANSSGNSGWPATARRLQGQTINYE